MTATFEGHVLSGDLHEDMHAAIRDAGLVGWDIETTGLDWAQDIIASCQIHAAGLGTVIVRIDPFAGVPKLLADLLEDSVVTKVFHHAPFDLRFMAARWDVRPVNVACTKIASKIARPGANPAVHSLKASLLAYLGVSISKEERMSDWLATHLTEAQLEYAARDVEYLLPLYACLQGELRELGRLDFYRSCLQHLPTRVQLEIGGFGDVYAY